MTDREKMVELLNNSFAEQYEKRGLLTAPHTATDLIAHGVTVQEWISVKDRLPEESGMYIVTANDGHAQRVSFVLWQKKNRMWSLNGARSYWRITHWQPMPQPPKEGE